MERWREGEREVGRRERKKGKEIEREGERGREVEKER